MILFYPVQFVVVCFGIAWLLRYAGISTRLVPLAATVGTILLAILLGSVVLSALASGGLVLLGAVALLAIGIVSYRMFAEQREKLFGKAQQDSSPKRRHGARHD